MQCNPYVMIISYNFNANGRPSIFYLQIFLDLHHFLAHLTDPSRTPMQCMVPKSPIKVYFLQNKIRPENCNKRGCI